MASAGRVADGGHNDAAHMAKVSREGAAHQATGLSTLNQGVKSQAGWRPALEQCAIVLHQLQHGNLGSAEGRRGAESLEPTESLGESIDVVAHNGSPQFGTYLLGGRVKLPSRFPKRPVAHFLQIARRARRDARQGQNENPIAGLVAMLDRRMAQRSAGRVNGKQAALSKRLDGQTISGGQAGSFGQGRGVVHRQAVEGRNSADGAQAGERRGAEAHLARNSQLDFNRSAGQGVTVGEGGGGGESRISPRPTHQKLVEGIRLKLHWRVTQSDAEQSRVPIDPSGSQSQTAGGSEFDTHRVPLCYLRYRRCRRGVAGAPHKYVLR